GGVRVDVAAPPHSTVAVGEGERDTLGTADTAHVVGVGASVVEPAASDALVARTAGATATVASPPPVRLGSVVVLGRAGWEAKFVAAALEERGWSVRLRVSGAPGIVV